jgi:hypothetical protein
LVIARSPEANQQRETKAIEAVLSTRHAPAG